MGVSEVDGIAFADMSVAAFGKAAVMRVFGKIRACIRNLFVPRDAVGGLAHRNAAVIHVPSRHVDEDETVVSL